MTIRGRTKVETLKREMPHRRYNPLTQEWVLVSPHRDRRPWLGQVEKTALENLPAFDPTCYLCPGNIRSGGHRNPPYSETFVFDNDFPALLLPGEALEGFPGAGELDGLEKMPAHLFSVQPEVGICRVVCFSPRHDLTLPELSQAEVEAVVRAWIEQTQDLGSRDFIHYVQVFENKGAMMGCSNPHPHSQIWATGHVPNEPARELAAQAEYQAKHGSCLLCDYLAAEQANGERLVTVNNHFVVLVPFWAVWPFEVLLIARRHVTSLTDLGQDEIAGLADIVRRITARYDNLFEISFPYSMGFHQAPSNVSGSFNHLHAHYYPPLLRSATVRKFMVGFEMLSMPQRDLTAEKSAERLRSLSEVHYRTRER